jgi:hypothetical protein
MPNPAPRADRRCSRVDSAIVVATAYWLLSMKKQSGRL